MLTLTEGNLLFHGSFTSINQIDLSVCKNGKDFGKGFYLTTDYDQAKNFVPLTVKREIKAGALPSDYSSGYVSVFRYLPAAPLEKYYFSEADREWLHFVAANRRGSLFPELQEKLFAYDIIGGKIANDRTAQTLQLYIAGAYGIPGSEAADNIAISTLLPNRLQNQYCFKTQAAVNALHFLRSDEINVD